MVLRLELGLKGEFRAFTCCIVKSAHNGWLLKFSLGQCLVREQSHAPQIVFLKPEFHAVIRTGGL